MTYFSHPWRLRIKIISIILAFILLSSTTTMTLIVPRIKDLQSLHQKSSILTVQLQQKRERLTRYQQLQRDIAVLEYRYNSRLEALRRRLAPSDLYTQITLLAKSHALQVMTLKPKKHQTIFGLESLLLEIDLNGAELNLLNFLQLLTHQSWLLDIQQIEMTPAKNATALHTILAIYYDAR